MTATNCCRKWGLAGVPDGRMPHLTGEAMKLSRRWIETALTTAAEVQGIAMPWSKPARPIAAE